MTSAKAKRLLVLAACLAAEPTLAAEPAVAESFLQVPAGSGLLKGTLLAPKSAPSAAVLIVPGSGPTDRDGNNPHALKSATYRLLAEGLAARGIATLRIDKRGMFGSATAVADANAVTIADYASDVHAWVAELAKTTGVSCVWVLGHSEGGLVALVAGTDAPDVCGLVLVSSMGRPYGEVLRSQLRAGPMPAAMLDQAMHAIDALEQGQRVDTTAMPPALLPLFRPNVQGFLINAFSYDPAKLAARATKPVLVLQGERDIQVAVADARLLKQADPHAELVLLPNVNHPLKAVDSDSRQANLATYSDPSLPLAPGVVDAIAGFLSRHPADGRQ